MSILTYQPTVLQGTTKVGKLRCDPDGYYDVILGGFDTYNSANAFYTWSSAKSHFDQSSHFMRRVQSAALYGEYGHPVPVPNMDKQAWLMRVLTIDPDRKSHHIRELTIDDETFKNKNGGQMITIFGRVKPSGPRAQALGDSLDNEHENTAFSIRSITDDFIDPRSGLVIKNMRQIVTYDYVDEPGIKEATKYNHPALENHALTGESVFNRATVLAAWRKAKEYESSGFESSGIVASLESLLDLPSKELKSQLIGKAKLPKSAGW